MLNYDLIVIGSGPAGHTAALKASSKGLSTALIERSSHMLGGTCLNEGCIPAKSLLHDAAMFSYLKKNPSLCGAELCPDMQYIVEKSIKAKEQLKKGLSFMIKKHKVDLINAEARLVGDSTVRIKNPDGKEEDLMAKNILLATGSRPKELPITRIDGQNVINSSHAIKMNTVPKDILIVGGGAIGVEFASFFNSLGTKVTIIEMESSLLPNEDTDITRRLSNIFAKKGINILTSKSITSVSCKNGAVDVQISDVKNQTLSFQKVLIAAGRCPNTTGIGLEDSGVIVDDSGFIEVDENLMTNVPGIYASGDIIKTPMLAHTASAEGTFVASILNNSSMGGIDYNNVPNAVYSEVEVSSLGFTQEQCDKEGFEYEILKRPFMSNGRAVACGESDGFIKIIASKNDGKILGAHIIGYKATELIHEFVLARKYGLTCEDIAHTIHAHPTFSETIMEACIEFSK